MPGYKKKYMKIYFWQSLSFVLNFVALFIVTPMLSSSPEIFGIYSVCAGLNIFLLYADVGFLMAGKKFASETVVQGDINKEKKIVGTSMTIYSAFSLLIFFGILACIYNPNIIISGVSNNKYHYQTAQALLCVLCMCVFVTILQKYVELIYSLRIEEYKLQRAIICGNLIKILSVPFYFFNNKYDIVGYYAFSQFVMLLSCIYVLYKSKDIGYGISSLYNILRFDKKSFNCMKKLALGGFSSTLSWILFYEIDTFAISVLLGAKMVAIYVIGRNIQTFVRSITGIVYGPYNVRFNYFIGLQDIEGMRKFFHTLTSFLCVLIIPIVAICFFAEPFVIAWVGPEYKPSIIILQILVLCFIYNGITNPCSSIVYSFNKYKDVIRLSVLGPIIFWIGVFITVKYWGLNSFAYFKLLACTITALYYIYIADRTLTIGSWSLIIYKFLYPLSISIVCSFGVLKISSFFLHPIEKSSTQLLWCIVWIALACLLSFIGYLLLYKSFRRTIFQLIKQ